MRVQKNPTPNTLANTWAKLADVPDGITTEAMTPAEFSTWLNAQPPIQRDPAEVAAEELTRTEREEARAIIAEMTTLAHDGVTTIAQANVAIKKIARGLRWQLRQTLQA